MTKHHDTSHGDRSRNINTLRVTSTLWPGIKTYSGITEDTVLCPVNMHRPDMTKRRVNGPHRLGLVPAQKSNYFRDERSDNEQIYQMHRSSDSSPQRHEDKLTPLGLPRAPAEDSTERLQKAVARPRSTVPLVSWNEAPADRSDDPRYSIRRGLKVTSCTVFNQNCQPAPRPYTAGPRVVVPPKHNCPAGLTSDDLIQGKKLLSECSKNCDDLKVVYSEHSLTDSQTDTKEIDDSVQGAHSKTSHFNTKESAQKSSIRHLKSANPYNRLRCETGFTKDGTFKPLSSSSSERYIRLELTIMSIDTHRATEQYDNLHETSARAYVTSAKTSLTSAQTLATEKSESHPVSELKILDGKTTIQSRHRFRRAQSAPPISRCPLSFIQTTRLSKVKGQPDTRTTTEEAKKFSNVYWRARSSYHRRNLELNRDARTDAGASMVAPQPNGSLLRPLMYCQDGAPMKHSAGCPYKCKECFKACLVSEDYVTDSKIGAGSPRKASTRKTDASATQRHKTDPLAVVRRALGRSQPLFKQVYGETVEDTICPWPTYAWVDIKKNIQKSI